MKAIVNTKLIMVDGIIWDGAVTFEDGKIVEVEHEYDKSIYTLVASICDNMDGTITVRVGREDTVEDKLRDTNKALQKANAEQAEIINILAGGAV